MTKNTKIEWAHHTFNPWIGCTAVSPACDHCYAENMMDTRLKVVKWGAGQERKRTSESNWQQPIKWSEEAKKLGVRHRVFCASLADVFDNEVPKQWRMDFFSLIAKTPHLDWLILTKRIGNVVKMCVDDGLMFDMLSSRVWLGITVCNQQEADRDIPKLLEAPAAKRFLSMEPLLGHVKLGYCLQYSPSAAYLDGRITKSMPAWTRFGSTAINWVIVGGESGNQARPMHPDWVTSLREQCNAANVPFLFKQWGEWEVASRKNGHYDSDMGRNNAFWIDQKGALHKPSSLGLDDPIAMVKVGKKAAGRLLDGRLWDEVPA